jgi:hypothetical protein
MRVVSYAIDSVMPRNANVLLAAQFKAGKTTLVNNVTKSLVDGMPFLGKFETAALTGRVAIWNYEVDTSQYTDWLRQSLIESASKITVLNLRGYRLPLATTYGENWAVEWLRRYDIQFWIIDPFARAYVGSGNDENDNTQVGAFLDTLDVIKSRAGVSELLLTTHTGRAEQEAGKERARGATRLDDWADVRWIVTRDGEHGRYFRATGRDVELPEAGLSFDENTRRLSIGTESRAASKSGRYQDAMLAIVRRSPGITTRALRENMREMLGSIGQQAIDEARGTLKRSGRIRVEIENTSTKHYPVSPADLIGPAFGGSE